MATGGSWHGKRALLLMGEPMVYTQHLKDKDVASEYPGYVCVWDELGENGLCRDIHLNSLI